MSAVTVGIPVYNGAPHLANALECVRNQSFEDLEILIFDNASTDETPNIAARYAALDPRIRYLRQPFNKGPIPNFGDLVRAAASPYFLWRAADDLSAPNYIEALHEVLETRREKQLAVGRIIESRDGRILREREPLRLGQTLGDRLGLLFDAPAAVFYGLYRREPLLEVVEWIGERYGEPAWGWDYLALLPFFLDNRVTQTDATTFEFVLRGAPRPPGQRREPPEASHEEARLGARRRFLAIARELADERYRPGPRRALAHAVVWAYANRRVLKFRRVLGCKLRRRFL